MAMFQPVKSITHRDLTEFVVTRQQLIERSELARCIRLNGFTHMLVDKRFEPIS